LHYVFLKIKGNFLKELFYKRRVKLCFEDFNEFIFALQRSDFVNHDLFFFIHPFFIGFGIHDMLRSSKMKKAKKPLPKGEFCFAPITYRTKS